ncbi:MAG: hypothetical protein KDD70_00670 [Bdellovibrionales bacterium]|nr:hypothetical protein [Bdellovibrionales bacterium]
MAVDAVAGAGQRPIEAPPKREVAKRQDSGNERKADDAATFTRSEEGDAKAAAALAANTEGRSAEGA